MIKPYCWLVLIVLAMLLCREALGTATNRYVATNAPGSAWPYDSWTKAATNIKDAVDVANSNNAGDIVYVSNGTYRVSVQISVTNCVVTNVNADPALVVIAGRYPASTNRCFYLNHSNAAVYGLTITNGCENDRGGGLYVMTGSVYRCLITGNSVTNASAALGGAGIYILNGIIADCTIANNTVSSTVVNYLGGGGVFIQNGGIVTVRGCSIERNVGAGTAAGGGIYGYYSSGLNSSVVENCSIISNQVLGDAYGGGGISCYASVAGCLLIRNCIIMGNSATNNNGGGLFFRYSNATVRNCLITHNVAHTYGGGIMMTDGGQVRGCTIVSNRVDHGGGGGIATGNYISNVADCIIYYNISPDIYPWSAAAYTSVTYSCTAPGSGMTIEGVVTNAPLFQNVSSNDFRLLRSSPCINAGLNEVWMEGALDLDGHARIDRFSGRVDMGAYEFLPAGTMFGIR